MVLLEQIIDKTRIEKSINLVNGDVLVSLFSAKENGSSKLFAATQKGEVYYTTRELKKLYPFGSDVPVEVSKSRRPVFDKKQEKIVQALQNISFALRKKSYLTSQTSWFSEQIIEAIDKTDKKISIVSEKELFNLKKDYESPNNPLNPFSDDELLTYLNVKKDFTNNSEKYLAKGTLEKDESYFIRSVEAKITGKMLPFPKSIKQLDTRMTINRIDKESIKKLGLTLLDTITLGTSVKTPLKPKEYLLQKGIVTKLNGQKEAKIGISSGNDYLSINIEQKRSLKHLIEENYKKILKFFEKPVEEKIIEEPVVKKEYKKPEMKKEKAKTISFKKPNLAEVVKNETLKLAPPKNEMKQYNYLELLEDLVEEKNNDYYSKIDENKIRALKDYQKFYQSKIVEGSIIQRYDNRIACDEMKERIMHDYQYSIKTLKELANDYKQEYGHSISASTISRRARKELGVKKRSDLSRD